VRTREGYNSEQIRDLAYIDILDKLPHSRAIVYQVISEVGPVSNEDIADILNKRINCITGRVKELRELGLIAFAGKAKSKTTGKTISLWRAEKLNEQLRMKL